MKRKCLLAAVLLIGAVSTAVDPNWGEPVLWAARSKPQRFEMPQH